MSSQWEDAHPDPPCAHGLTGGRGAAERCLECGASVTAASPDERLRQRLAGLDTVEVQESALDDPETFVRKADLDAALAEAPGSPDERLREAVRDFLDGTFEGDGRWDRLHAALVAADREKPDEPKEKP